MKISQLLCHDPEMPAPPHPGSDMPNTADVAALSAPSSTREHVVCTNDPAPYLISFLAGLYEENRRIRDGQGNNNGPDDTTTVWSVQRTWAYPEILPDGNKVPCVVFVPSSKDWTMFSMRLRCNNQYQLLDTRRGNVTFRRSMPYFAASLPPSPSFPYPTLKNAT
ncbi:hypothetical protein DFH09DRAFT_1077463 [Mycena vulgaris]|nr:hypothetical protein DFH09DRAFT_1077463 [Mycena vulgaris]